MFTGPAKERPGHRVQDGQDYFATYFKGMLDQYGGVETAKRLLAKSQPQTGLFRLLDLKLGIFAYPFSVRSQTRSRAIPLR